MVASIPDGRSAVFVLQNILLDALLPGLCHVALRGVSLLGWARGAPPPSLGLHAATLWWVRSQAPVPEPGWGCVSYGSLSVPGSMGGGEVSTTG